MIYSLTWLPAVLENAGLRVAEVPGWTSRGHADMGDVRGVICHHTVGRREGNMPSLNTLIHGRKDLSGPLAQLGLGRDGTFYVIAAGLCYHAGKGEWKGVAAGNKHFIGIEAENTGGPDDYPWPEKQMVAYQRGVAAILMHIGRNEEYCAGHKEYALPKGRKPDPSFDMNLFRDGIRAYLSNSVPPPALIPKELSSSGNGKTYPTIQRGSFGAEVKLLQSKLNLTTDGNFGPKTEAAVRVFQRNSGLHPDGVVGPKTWAAIL